ncbi:MAG: PEGA domain-containing protein [Myxococcota bacterium]
MKAVAWGLLLALGMAAGASAQSDPVVAKAKDFFDVGRRAYEAGQFKAAITAFQESYRLAPRSATVFSLAQAHRLLYFQEKDPTNLKRAIDLYRQYLVEEPQGARRGDSAEFLGAIEPIWGRMEDSQRRAAEAKKEIQAETQLMLAANVSGAIAEVDGKSVGPTPLAVTVTPGAHKVKAQAPGYRAEESDAVAVAGTVVMVGLRLEPEPATLDVRAPDGVEVSVEGRPVGEAPLPGPLSLPAGRHFLSFTERGHFPVTRELVLERGAKADVEVELETTNQRTVAYAAWILAGAVGIAGGITTGIAVSKENEALRIEGIPASAQRPITAEEVRRHDALIDQRDRFAVISGVGLGAAALAGLAGTILYLFDFPRVVLPEGGSVDLSPAAPPAGPQILGHF